MVYDDGMDPNATMQLLLGDDMGEDISVAVEAAEDLIEWLDKGGFPPDGYTVEETREVAQNVLRSAR
jgi:hypothetical protein